METQRLHRLPNPWGMSPSFRGRWCDSEPQPSPRQRLPLSSPPPPSRPPPPPSSFITGAVCLSGQLVVRAETSQALCPPAWGSGDHYGRQHRRRVRASVTPVTVRACDVLTSLRGTHAAGPDLGRGDGFHSPGQHLWTFGATPGRRAGLVPFQPNSWSRKSCMRNPAP